ncbi:MAG: tetratricopeptide repeat protein [Myxococcota bacterium]
MSEGTGLKLSRYELKGKLSADTVSVLYGALDLHSGRRIALRVIRPEAALGPEVREEILRRARALTTLRHPNVTPVYEVGEDGSEIYLAEELIYGPTLEQWVAERRRGWREICRTYMQAGGGLLALHAAGLVAHGFSPTDVVITKERRVVLSDALVLRALVAPSADAQRTPEELAGRPADARSDQYLFAASLFTALTGAPPPSDPSLVIAALTERKLPRGIAPVLEKALSLEPEQRYATMREMLAALAGPVEAAGYSPRLVLAIGAAAVLAMFLGMVLGAASGGSPLPSTTDVRERWCEGRDVSFSKVWNPEANRKARWAMWKTETPVLSSSWLVVEGTLDRWIQDWQETFRRICGVADTPLRPEELERAATCLMSERERALAFLGVLSEIGPERTIAALRGLRSPGSCGAVDHETVVWIDRVLSHKVATITRTSTGPATSGGDAADANGFLAWAEGEYELAAQHFEAALPIFEARHADLETADTLSNLALLRYELGSLDEAINLLRRAAKLRENAVGSEDPVLADYLQSLGLMIGQKGQLSEALVIERRALSIRERTLSPDAPEVGESFRAIGWLENASHRWAEALESYRHALTLRVAAYGEDSGEVTQVRIELGWVLLSSDKLGEAQETFERARMVAQQAGRRSVLMAQALTGEGAARLAKKDAPGAVEVLEEALKIRESIKSDRRAIAEVQVLLARALLEGGLDRPRALRLLSSAGVAYNETGSGESPEASEAARLLAEAEGAKR